MAGRPRIVKTEFAQRLIEARGAHSAGEIVAQCEVKPGTYAAYERGDSIPDAEFMRRFVEFTGADAAYLLTGHRADGLEAIVPSEFALLPRYNIEASAGPGLAVIDEIEIERIAFRLDWLREIGLDPKQCGLLTSRGDSMPDTAPDGAIMLIDMRKDQPLQTGCVYVIALDGDVLVKKISRNVDRTVDLISENPDYPKQTVTQVDLDRLFIAGRVFWVGRKV